MFLSACKPSRAQISSIPLCSVQNSILPEMAIIRTELSPPKPEPSKLVDGLTVLVIANASLSVLPTPGIPAVHTPVAAAAHGKPKLAW